MSDPDIAPEDKKLLADSLKQRDIYASHSTYEKKDFEPTFASKPRPEPDFNIDETDESRIYVSRSTLERRLRERTTAPEPDPEHPIIKPKHPTIEDDLADDGQDFGQELADDYQSRSTYVFTPPPPKRPKPTKHRHLEQEDIAPEDKEVMANAEQTGEIHKPRSTYDVGEIGSVVLEGAERLFEKSKRTATETKIVEHKKPPTEIDDVDETDGALSGQGRIYESHSTYEVGKPIEGTSQYLAALAASGGVSFLRGAAYTVNPLEWARGLHELTYLAKSPYAQKQFAEQIAEDPIRFTVDLGAGIAGGYAAGKFIGKLYRGVKEAELKAYYEEFPEEAFYLEDGIPDPAFPEQVSVQKSTFTGFEKKKVRIDYDSGGTEGLYYGMDPLDEGARASKITGLPDESLRTKWEFEGGRMRIAMDQGTPPISATDDLTKITKTKKGLIYKIGDEYGLVQTGHDLVPTILPEGVGKIETIYRPIAHMQYELSHLPGVRRLPPYFDAALELSLSPFAGYLPIAGGSTGLITSITPDIDKPLDADKPDIIQKSTPTIDDPSLDETSKIIEVSDETFRQKPDPKPPIIVPRPPKIIEDPWIEPGYIEKPDETTDLDEDTDITTITTTITTPIHEQITEIDIPLIPTPTIFIPDYAPPNKRPPKMPPLKQKRRPRKKKGSKHPLGWEMKEYAVPPIEIMIGKPSKTNKKTRKKKRRLPPL